MQQLKPRLAHLGMAAGCLALMACENSGQERNFERLEEYAGILATARTAEPADLTGVTGTATYRGVGFGEFPAADAVADGDGGGGARYSATSDVTLTADFTGGTLSGEMTDWTPEDPLNYTMRGKVLISEGDIAPDGTFTAKVSGAVEREATARLIDSRGGPDPSIPDYYQYGFNTDAEGTFHDGLDGARASHVIGSFDGAGVSGGFVAKQ